MKETSRIDASLKQHESFLALGRFAYLRVALVLCVLATVGYFAANPADQRSGSTWAGYALGALCVLLVLWLTLLGVRKRSYRSSLGTVRGWTSAHVYLGLSLLYLVALHSAFQLGWNLPTLAFTVIALVIVSGLYGIVSYSYLPERITANRQQQTREAMVAELEALNQRSLVLSDAISPEVHRRLIQSVDRARIGGGLRTQVFMDTAAFRSEASSTVAFMASQVASMDHAAQQAEKARELLDVLSRRRDLVERVNRDIRLHGRMQLWLYVHVPLSFAALAALAAHILSVFVYR
jgi:hypothetical protein